MFHLIWFPINCIYFGIGLHVKDNEILNWKLSIDLNAYLLQFGDKELRLIEDAKILSCMKELQTVSYLLCTANTSL